jgi:hypothetical protein
MQKAIGAGSGTRRLSGCQDINGPDPSVFLDKWRKDNKVCLNKINKMFIANFRDKGQVLV